MSPSLFTSGGQPAYHACKLIVKLAPQSSEPMAALHSGFTTAAAVASASGNVGLDLLQRFERAGLLRHITPLSRRTALPTAGLGFALATMAASAAAPDRNARVSLIELEDDTKLPELRDALAADPMVEYVSRVPIRYLCVPGPRGTVKTPKSGTAAPAAVAPTNSAMWNLPAIKWSEARAKAEFRDAESIKVAVLDTGIDQDHPDFAGRIASYVYAHPLIPTASGAKDYIGHGTHVAGTVAAGINNTIGINGICTCQLHIWKIFNDQPTYDAFSDRFVYFVDTVMYHRALADCLDEGIQVVNLSIGGSGKPDANEELLFSQLVAAGTTIVAAMGNERQYGSPTSYPAAISGVIAVGATNIVDQVTGFSNRGPHIAISAPGDTIWSTLPTYDGQTRFRARLLPDGSRVTGEPESRDTYYAAWAGTSMASPHVAAAAALLLSKNPALRPAEVRQRLMDTADKVPGMGTQTFHQDYGAGRLNLLRLLS